MIHGDLQALADLLLVKAQGGTLVGGQPAEDRYRIYGGQLLGQGLVAACLGDSRPVRSLHASFIRAGDTNQQVEYSVETIAGSQACRRVTATQADRLLFSMDVLLTGYSPAQTGPAVQSTPESAIPRERGIAGLDTDTEASWAVTDSPFDNHFVENIWSDDFHQPGHGVWFRGRGGILPSDPDTATQQQLRQAILAYYSDDTIMDNALFPHGWMTQSATLQTASLDHVMWFHGDYRLDEWLFFDQDSPVAAGARGMTRGTVSKTDGTRVASIFQEIFMRPAAQ